MITSRALLKNVTFLALLACLLCLAQSRPAQADSLLLPGYNSTSSADVERDENGNPLPPGFLAVDEGLSIGVGATVGSSPYKKYSTQWTPFPIISYEAKYAYIRGMTAGLKLINEHFFELSAFVGYDDTNFDASDSTHHGLKRLKDRHSSAVAGLEARVLTPIGLLSANASGDILGHSNGFTGTVAYTYSQEFGDLELDPSVGVTWHTSKYNNYYYGIKGHESRRSGLDSYDAGAGVSPFVNLTAIYSINDQWSVFCSGQVQFLESAVRDSPMVGEKATYSGRAGISYSFF